MPFDATDPSGRSGSASGSLCGGASFRAGVVRPGRGTPKPEGGRVVDRTRPVGAPWRRVLVAAGLAAAAAAGLAAPAAAAAQSCASLDAFGNTYTFSAMPGSLDFGEPLSLSFAYSATGTADPGASLRFVDGPRYGSTPDSGAAAYLAEYPIAAFTPSSTQGARTLLGALVPGVHYLRTSTSAAADAAPCVTIVSQNATTTRLYATPTSITYGDTVTLRASVAAATLPTGSVSFTDTGTALGSAAPAPRAVPTTLALGSDNVCSVTGAGAAECWGENGRGQLGDGTTTARSAAAGVTGLSSGVRAVAAGYQFACALKNDGGAACWGSDTYGELGDNGSTDRSTPVAVSGVSDAVAITAGDSHACVLGAAGAVSCWGRNGAGQLGDGSTTDRRTPVAVTGLPSGVIAIDAGGAHSCALTDAGEVWCWGSNASGELGAGDLVSSSVPRKVSGLSTATAVTAGTVHTCALLDDTTARCWGDNTDGELGNLSTVRQTTPATVSGLANAISIGAGYNATCAVKTDHTVACWGRNDHGQIGNGTTTNATSPQSTGSLSASASPFQLNGLASPSSPVYATDPVGVVTGGSRTLVLSDLGALSGFGALYVPSLTATPTDTKSAASVRAPHSVGVVADALLETTAIDSGNRTVAASYGGDGGRAGSTAAGVSVTVAPVATTTVLSTSASNFAYGDAVTLTATVTPANTVGSVTFFDGVSSLGSIAVTGGIARITTRNVAVGARSLSAVFGGSANFLLSTSGTVSVTVTRQTPTVTVSTDATLADYGDAVHATVAVSPSGATGSVILYDNGSPIGSTGLSGGSAVFTLTTLLPGRTHSLSAYYGGDSNLYDASSGTVDVTIRKITPTLSIATSPASPVYGTTTTFITTVGSLLPLGGSVSYSVDGASIGSAPVNSSGQASLDSPTIAAGSHTVTAVYSGDTNAFGATTSQAYTIAKVTPSVTVTPTVASPRVGQTFTLNASFGPATATGTVTFFEGVTSLGTATIAAGVASIDLPGQAVGTHTYKAVYGGSANFNGATSPDAAVPVIKGESTVTAVASDTVFGQIVAIAVGLEAVSPAVGAPNGTVRVMEGATQVGSAQIPSAPAAGVVSVFNPTIGDHTYTLVYDGNGSFETSTSAPFTVTVSKGSTTVSLTGPAAAVETGKTVQVTATVAAFAPAVGTPTGTVTFKDGTTVLATVGLSSGTASYQTTSLSIATHQITATYSGDGNFVSSQDSTAVVVSKGSLAVTLTGGSTATWPGTVVLTATVTPSNTNLGKPSGKVSFLDGANLVTTSTLGAGVAVVTLAFAPGSHDITVFYAGDGTFERGSSTIHTVTVGKASVNVVLFGPSATVIGQTLSYTAAVTGSFGSLPAGTVDFYDGTAVVASVAFPAGGYSVSANIPMTTTGNHAIKAVYRGTSTISEATSNGVTTAVNLASFNTALTTGGPVVHGQTATLTATLLPVYPSTAAPTGAVVFSDGSTEIGTARLVAGVAKLQVSNLSTGAHTIKAAYDGDPRTDGLQGDGVYGPGTPVTDSLTVNPAATSVAATGPSTRLSGQPAVFRAIVTAVAPGAGTPTGTVSFLSDGTAIGSAPLTNGLASLTVTDIAVGTHTVTATYVASTDFATSTSTGLPLRVDKAASRVTVSGANRRVYGEPGTATVTVAAVQPGGGTPTGTVDLFTATGKLATLTLTNGVATYATDAFAPAAYVLTASYGGDGAFLGSASGGFSTVVAKGPTATTVTAPATSVFGETVTLSATVATDVTAATPTGTVTFLDGTRVLGSGPLSAGTVTLDTAALTVNTHAVTASYSGDGLFMASTAAPAKIATAKATSTTTLAAPATVVFGQPVTVTATVAAVSPSGATPTGAVLFRLDGTLIASTNLDAGTARVTTMLPTGRRRLSASYVGDGGFLASASTVTTVTVDSGSAAVALTVPAAKPLGETVRLSAAVTAVAPSIGTPTGLVTFASGAATLGTAVLSRGEATLDLATLPLGTQTITATYKGDGDFATATSPDATIDIGQGAVSVYPTGTTRTVYGAAANFGAVVRAKHPAAGLPSGTVTFRDGATVLGTVPILGGGASLTTRALAVGSHTVTATYDGDTHFTTVAGAAVSTTVDKSSTVVAVVAPSSPVVGETVPVTVVVTAYNTGPDKPSGAVDLYDGTTKVASATLSNGTASLPQSGLPIGRHGFTAVYAGDGNYLAAGSSPVQVTVGKGTATITVATGPATPVFGQPVTLTATLAAAAPAVGTPTGTIAFRDGSAALGEVAIAGGTASVTVATLSAGSHGITAVYSGDGSFIPGTSPTQALAVAKGATTIDLSGPATSGFGTVAAFDVTVAVTAPAAGTPAGRVDFYDGSEALGSVSLSGGTARFKIASLPGGVRAIKAIYAGNDRFAGSASSVLSTTVEKAATDTVLTANVPVVRPGGDVTLSAATTVSGKSDRPPGVVTFRREGTAFAAVPLIIGRAAAGQTLTQSGTVAFDAIYDGTGNYEQSTGTLSVPVDAAVDGPSVVNGRTNGLQNAPAAAALADGGTVVVWQSDGEDGSGLGVFGRRFLSSGVSAGPAVRVNAFTAGDQGAPTVAALAGGGFVVAWQSDGQDGSGTGIRLQRYAASGGLVGGEIAANTLAAGDQAAPVVAGLANGGFAVAWQSTAPGADHAMIYVRRWSAAGIAAGVESRLDRSDDTSQTAPRLVRLADGSLLAAWTSTDPADGSVSIQAQAISAGGVRIGGLRNPAGAVSDARHVALAAMEDGGYAAAFDGPAAAPGLRAVYVRRFAEDGTTIPGVPMTTIAGAVDRTDPTVAGFPSGGLVVAWTSAETTGAALGYRRFHADGTAADVELPFTDPAADVLESPVIVARSDLDFDLYYATVAPSGGEIGRQGFTLGAPAP